MIDTTLGFDAALNGLKQAKSLDFAASRSELPSVKCIASVYTAYRQLFPDDYLMRLKEMPRSLLEARSVDLNEIITGALVTLFPVSDIMLEEISDCIRIEPQNISMSYDEFDEFLEAGEDYFMDHLSYRILSFPMLIWSIGNGIDKETWERLDDIFSWSVPWPRRLIQTKYYFDEELLDKKLKRAGLEDFTASIRIAWRMTGNIFLDFDENGQVELPSFDAENICRLVKEWAAAKLILERDHKAMLMLQEDPTILQKIVKIMGRSLERPQKAKTLIEVFEGSQEGTHA